ncbi:MAG: D-alanine-D-alanine ligase [Candidatus Nomurabacteria bacterium GW2011_GWF2_40_31]|uniref:D-alanine-D-alanine ligase n=2 Tax=Candidatus Nomuraibacteriota TaxID=1752729 RepID=A0A837HV46_9BACT|nr:MAG: D-alanine-D-alanine ligase [Candidatus Nomurabacteria bacterium GW2011_GWD2_39_12]KKR20121.1 MAG: D-alanine-D-alanine ligase [Candidatus Nomurabacteria bacterium GW2011_GWC2_39_41]KKR36638.1 MAG: D-alanine-D-alanine ligase [Candidatus Nomurabacteria bacterium GW2011_GWE2_40_10]KKR38057.1 MAG: D-alanine-D-alanine ligase [Candidatus Nomurabacteria bacterium GW2011_GWB1_40_11]KKR39541.1 MAG: D-alanine-D-alanine ligase [Parcubacteria group bacterium GW2011_GWC1_40_11]KKR58998.1 MAG: D-alan
MGYFLLYTLYMKRVGILRGGAGEHYESSLQKGGDIISHIFENLADKYQPIDIFVDKDYIWHIGGLPVNPGDLLHRVDVVWNTTHPSFSNMLSSLSIPTVSTSPFSFLLENNQALLREHVKQIGVAVPRAIILPVYQKDFDGPRERYAIKKAKEVHEKFGAPWIVKSLTPDESMGIHLAKTFPELVNAIEDGLKHEQSILVEEFIAGKVAALHSVAGFRGEDIYTFSPVDVFGNLSQDEKSKLLNIVKDLYEHLGIKHYLKSMFVLNPRGKVYLLDIQTVPDLKPDSHFDQVCESVGAKMHHVVEHILEKALPP